MNKYRDFDNYLKEYPDENGYFGRYGGRPTPLYHCQRLSNLLGRTQIYIKREDLNHTGAHKLNHCMGQGLLAKYMGKKKLIAETGAGQHGVALAYAIREARENNKAVSIIVNLSGRGDKDLDFVVEHYGYGEKYLK